MHLHDFNARRQFAREHADELANDFRRAQKASAPELPPKQAGHADPTSLLDRLRRRRPARAAAQQP